MNQVVNSPGVQYAVVEGLHTETGNERVVIAYQNERSLRELIAAPAILGFGFSSREEALAGGRGCAAAVAAHQQRLSWATLQIETGSAFRKLGRVLVTCCCDVVASISVLFSSSSFVSVAIRMALGSGA